eukprot:gnl/MRDRNA2_/MRDRNA2_66901_c0_seq1.p1 gnl/MRDRNA2_/MRDRNA2_66901_c0~~gnl/MRDRNA2_/MRDRNA2_66901_c0_seq1.p1  ORF type:complete len:413 (+),score=78.68 gnl/MRDRNA2_/MRDRNA2_66901_c0_seq1:39-1241(+)
MPSAFLNFLKLWPWNSQASPSSRPPVASASSPAEPSVNIGRDLQKTLAQLDLMEAQVDTFMPQKVRQQAFLMNENTVGEQLAAAVSERLALGDVQPTTVPSHPTAPSPLSRPELTPGRQTETRHVLEIASEGRLTGLHAQQEAASPPVGTEHEKAATPAVASASPSGPNSVRNRAPAAFFATLPPPTPETRRKQTPGAFFAPLHPTVSPQRQGTQVHEAFTPVGSQQVAAAAAGSPVPYTSVAHIAQGLQTARKEAMTRGDDAAAQRYAASYDELVRQQAELRRKLEAAKAEIEEAEGDGEQVTPLYHIHGAPVVDSSEKLPAQDKQSRTHRWVTPESHQKYMSTKKAPKSVLPGTSLIQIPPDTISIVAAAVIGLVAGSSVVLTLLRIRYDGLHVMGTG